MAEHPTEWFEVEQRVLGSSETWQTVDGGDRIGAPTGGRREGQHEAQIVSVRANRGEMVRWGTFQLAFSFGGANYRERYTDGAYSDNQTAVITAPIAWDASALQVSFLSKPFCPRSTPRLHSWCVS